MLPNCRILFQADAVFSEENTDGYSLDFGDMQ